jgi:DnaK suppressor protein
MNTATRTTDLRQMLLDRQRQLQDDVQNRIRGGRADHPGEVHDEIEASDIHLQGDLEFALLQMRVETLARIGQALVRLDAGEYGSCAECDREISARRLRALPFAVRCQPCEEQREIEQGRARHLELRRGNFSLFPEAVGS